MKHKCWKCNGRGWLYDYASGICTLGIGYLIQAVAGKHSCNINGEYINDRCDVCGGKGWQDDDGGNRRNMANWEDRGDEDEAFE